MRDHVHETSGARRDQKATRAKEDKSSLPRAPAQGVDLRSTLGNRLVARIASEHGIARQARDEQAAGGGVLAWLRELFHKDCLRQGALQGELRALGGDLENAERLLRVANAVRQFRTAAGGGGRLHQAAETLGQMRGRLVDAPLNFCARLSQFNRIRLALRALNANDNYADPAQARVAAQEFGHLFAALGGVAEDIPFLKDYAEFLKGMDDFFVNVENGILANVRRANEVSEESPYVSEPGLRGGN